MVFWAFCCTTTTLLQHAIATVLVNWGLLLQLNWLIFNILVHWILQIQEIEISRDWCKEAISREVTCALQSWASNCTNVVQYRSWTTSYVFYCLHGLPPFAFPLKLLRTLHEPLSHEHDRRELHAIIPPLKPFWSFHDSITIVTEFWWMNVGAITGDIKIWYHFGMLIHVTLLVFQYTLCSAVGAGTCGIGRSPSNFCNSCNVIIGHLIGLLISQFCS